MITTEAYIVGKVMKLDTLMSVCLRLVMKLSSSMGEASPSTLNMQSGYYDLIPVWHWLNHFHLRYITNLGMYGEAHNPTRKGLGLGINLMLTRGIIVHV